jgi:hypothetical protein
MARVAPGHRLALAVPHFPPHDAGQADHDARRVGASALGTRALRESCCV